MTDVPSGAASLRAAAPTGKAASTGEVAPTDKAGSVSQVSTEIALAGPAASSQAASGQVAPVKTASTEAAPSARTSRAAAFDDELEQATALTSGNELDRAAAASSDKELDRAAGNALHVPVLVDQCIELFRPALEGRQATLIDATVGMAGHAQALLESFEHLTVVGIDRDRQAIDLASRRLRHFGARFKPVVATYDRIDQVASSMGRDGQVEAVLMDLGVSSLQLDDHSRGFSYSQDAPLDMRMDASSGPSAAELLATMSAEEIAKMLREFGDEKFASRIARRITQVRATEPIVRTGQLAQIVRQSIPAAARRTGGNPSKRTFQALRIAVNDELAILQRAIPKAIEALAPGGRIVVESYQSLEDRIVKRELAKGATSSTPAGLPMELEGHEPYLRLLTRGAIKAADDERSVNPRSASVRLRAAEKIRHTHRHTHATTQGDRS